jgi:hypothetical protein
VKSARTAEEDAMARKTMEKKFADAKKKYEAELKKLGGELQKALVDLIAPHIPEGWYVVWHQSDEQYNDEDYYFGLDQQALCSVYMPKKGKLLKEAVERTYKTEKVDQYNLNTGRYEKVEQKVVDEWGSEAEYEWILDETCKKKRPTSKESPWEGEPCTINLDEDGDDNEPAYGITGEQLGDLRDVLQGIDEDDYERAFGDEATVRVYVDGTWTVD